MDVPQRTKVKAALEYEILVTEHEAGPADVPLQKNKRNRRDGILETTTLNRSKSLLD